MHFLISFIIGLIGGTLSAVLYILYKNNKHLNKPNYCKKQYEYLTEEFYPLISITSNMIYMLLDISKQKYKYEEDPYLWAAKQFHIEGIDRIGETVISPKTFIDAIENKLDPKTTKGIYLALSSIVNVGGI
jgi:hypothetical protein